MVGNDCKDEDGEGLEEEICSFSVATVVIRLRNRAHSASSESFFSLIVATKCS